MKLTCHASILTVPLRISVTIWWIVDLFCKYRPHLHCWAAMLGQGLSLLWAGIEWESGGAAQVSGLNAHWIKLSNLTVPQRRQERRKHCQVRWDKEEVSSSLKMPSTHRNLHQQCVLLTCVSCCGGVASMDTVLLSLVKNLSDRCARPDRLAHSRTIRKQAWICSTLERWNQPRDGPERDEHTHVITWADTSGSFYCCFDCMWNILTYDMATLIMLIFFVSI